MTYRLSITSINRLKGVHPDLVRVVQLAITRTPSDFTVFEGLRTLDRQRALASEGRSQTLNSRHLIQWDGFGHAVDLVPFRLGRPRWEWEPIYGIADTMADCARELDVRIRWGGSWSELNHITDSREAVRAYTERKRKAGQRAFTDGAHYELIL